MARPVGHPDSPLISSIGSHRRWLNTSDRTAATAAPRSAFLDRFEREAREQFGDLPPDELADKAERLRKIYFSQLALKSAQARRRKAKATAGRRSTPNGGLADAA